jgi:hypothetical protein
MIALGIIFQLYCRQNTTKTHTALENTTKNSYVKIKASWWARTTITLATLVHFMTFMNGIAYAKDHQFIQDTLASLTPDDLARWMCQKAYGTPEPNPDANPTQARSSSLHYWKKAISYYIPIF